MTTAESVELFFKEAFVADSAKVLPINENVNFKIDAIVQITPSNGRDVFYIARVSLD
jgi:hypothetical protein